MTGSGRTGTGHARYRRNLAAMLARSDRCGICGHGGAKTGDHIISARDWPRDATGRHLPGLNEPGNLQPAHGTLGAGRARLNRCPTCGRLCNQSKGAGKVVRPQSRRWFPDRL